MTTYEWAVQADATANSVADLEVCASREAAYEQLRKYYYDLPAQVVYREIGSWMPDPTTEKEEEKTMRINDHLLIQLVEAADPADNQLVFMNDMTGAEVVFDQADWPQMLYALGYLTTDRQKGTGT